jgi:Leucine-rich repeat (LRR) protein
MAIRSKNWLTSSWSLKSMLLLLTTFSMCAGYFGWRTRQLSTQHAAVVELSKLSGIQIVEQPPEPFDSAVLRLFLDPSIMHRVTSIHIGPCISVSERQRYYQLFDSLPWLVELDARWTDIDDTDLREICKRHPQLERMSLFDTFTTDDGLRAVAKLENLQELGVGVGISDPQRCALSEQGVAATFKISTLRSLSLDIPKLESTWLLGIENLRELTYLGLGDSSVDDSAIPTLRLLPNLVELDLSYTKVSPEGEALLKKFNPKLKVIRDE